LEPLSTRLRRQTAPLHREAEVLLGLPDAIRTSHDYRVWLGRFFGLYEPLELSLVAFPEWEALSLAPRLRSHSKFLADDLAALDTAPSSVPRAPPELLPNLPTFAHAFGALYVLEGSTLGGRLILRVVEARIGASIAGATGFFAGRGEAVGPMWKNFCTSLDGFGWAQPDLSADVMTGAERAYRSILAWFASF
jgi:heme oxygenase (biliverdin-IX-beta and delta-forming)